MSACTRPARGARRARLAPMLAVCIAAAGALAGRPLPAYGEAPVRAGRALRAAPSALTQPAQRAHADRRHATDRDARVSIRDRPAGRAVGQQRLSRHDRRCGDPGHLQRPSPRRRRRRFVLGERIEQRDGRQRRLGHRGRTGVHGQRHRRQLHDHRQLGLWLGAVLAEQCRGAGRLGHLQQLGARCSCRSACQGQRRRGRHRVDPDPSPLPDRACRDGYRCREEPVPGALVTFSRPPAAPAATSPPAPAARVRAAWSSGQTPAVWRSHRRSPPTASGAATSSRPAPRTSGPRPSRS